MGQFADGLKPEPPIKRGGTQVVLGDMQPHDPPGRVGVGDQVKEQRGPAPAAAPGWQQHEVDDKDEGRGRLKVEATGRRAVEPQEEIFHAGEIDRVSELAGIELVLDDGLFRIGMPPREFGIVFPTAGVGGEQEQAVRFAVGQVQGEWPELQRRVCGGRVPVRPSALLSAASPEPANHCRWRSGAVDAGWGRGN